MSPIHRWHSGRKRIKESKTTFLNQVLNEKAAKIFRLVPFLNSFCHAPLTIVWRRGHCAGGGCAIGVNTLARTHTLTHMLTQPHAYTHTHTHTNTQARTRHAHAHLVNRCLLLFLVRAPKFSEMDPSVPFFTRTGKKVWTDFVRKIFVTSRTHTKILLFVFKVELKTLGSVDEWSVANCTGRSLQFITGNCIIEFWSQFRTTNAWK